MVIEINKDIDRYQESVAMGLTAKQLLFSAASVVVGGGLVLLLYKYIGLTGAAYEYMGRKFHYMFGNKALTYVSTEGEPAIKAYEFEINNTGKKKKGKADADTKASDQTKNKEEFEAMKKKTRNILFGMIAAVIAAVAGIAIFKATR